VLPLLAGLLLLYARAGKRKPEFKLQYGEVRTDLQFFLVAYGLAIGCALVPNKPLHYAVAALLVTLYVFYVKEKFSGEGGEEGALPPLFFSPRAARPSYGLIAVQAIAGLAGLVAGAHLFVTAAKALAAGFSVSPLLLALFIAPLATELPEMSNSFLWLYQRKDGLAVGNVTGAMVFQGTFPVALGLIGTDWALESSALAAMGLALVASGLSLSQLLGGGHWRPWFLASGALLYVGYSLYLYGS
jgi:cation:H+ antiporter